MVSFGKGAGRPAPFPLYALPAACGPRTLFPSEVRSRLGAGGGWGFALPQLPFACLPHAGHCAKKRAAVAEKKAPLTKRGLRGMIDASGAISLNANLAKLRGAENSCLLPKGLQRPIQTAAFEGLA